MPEAPVLRRQFFWMLDRFQNSVQFGMADKGVVTYCPIGSQSLGVFLLTGSRMNR